MTSARKPGGVRSRTRLKAGYKDAASNELEAQIEYQKSEQTSFRLQADDVNVRSGSHKCFNLLWQIPGYGPSSIPETSGIVVSLGRSKYTVENTSDYVCFVRLQRPLAYKEAPSSISSWEPLSVNETSLIIELKPYEKRTLYVSNSGTSYLVPRHVNRDGLVYVHLMSVSVCRDPVSYHGTQLSPVGVMLTFDVDVLFRANDGSVGSHKGFVVETMPDSVFLDQVDQGPAVPQRVSDLTFLEKDKRHPVDQLIWKPESSMVKLYAIRNLSSTTDSKSYIEGSDIDLDRRTVWSVPVLVGCQSKDRSTATAYSIAVYRNGGFYLAQTAANNTHNAMKPDYQFAYAISALGNGWFNSIDPGVILLPLSKNSIPTVQHKKKSGLRKTVPPPNSNPSSVRSNFDVEVTLDTILDSVVIVIDVIRTVATFAAAVGFLDPHSNIVNRRAED